jgi:hypothetical protein
LARIEIGKMRFSGGTGATGSDSLQLSRGRYEPAWILRQSGDILRKRLRSAVSCGSELSHRFYWEQCAKKKASDALGACRI